MLADRPCGADLPCVANPEYIGYRLVTPAPATNGPLGTASELHQLLSNSLYPVPNLRHARQGRQGAGTRAALFFPFKGPAAAIMLRRWSDWCGSPSVRSDSQIHSPTEHWLLHVTTRPQVALPSSFRRLMKRLDASCERYVSAPWTRLHGMFASNPRRS